MRQVENRTGGANKQNIVYISGTCWHKQAFKVEKDNLTKLDEKSWNRFQILPIYLLKRFRRNNPLLHRILIPAMSNFLVLWRPAPGKRLTTIR